MLDRKEVADLLVLLALVKSLQNGADFSRIIYTNWACQRENGGLSTRK